MSDNTDLAHHCLTDWVGYEKLIDIITTHNLHHLEGDFVEIGTLFGGGARKLSTFLEEYAPHKLLYVIDIFDPNTDTTRNTDNYPMSELYTRALSTLGFPSQWEVFQKVTQDCKNIRVLKGDTKKVSLPTKNVAFAFIDANHSPDYVLNDFYLVWEKLVPRGCIAFDDYRGNLPQVTETIDQIISTLQEQLTGYAYPEGHIACLLKKDLGE